MPFIFVSGELGEEKAIEALRHGATDYVLKRRLSRLGGVVRRALQEDQEKRQRQQAEKALREAQARYRVLFEQSPDGIVIVDPETARFVEFNTAAHQQLGYSREEFAGLSIPDLEAAETPQETMAHIATIVRKGRDDFETRFRTKQGDIRHIYVTAQVVDVAGHPVYHCIWRDITERKQAEARMRLLSQALESAANAIVITDREGRISWVNPAFTQLTGYSLAEALDQKTSLLKSGVHDQAFYRALWETVLAGKVWSAVMINRRKDGSRYTEENTITPVRDERGEITHFIAIKQDITARQQAAEAVRQREEYFRALTEKAMDITTVLNADATFRYESPSVRQVVGYTPEELVGRIAFDFIHPEDLSRVQQAFSANVGTLGAVARHEFRFRHKDGTWRTLEATARNLLDDPNVAGIVLNSRDITERKQAEVRIEALRNWASSSAPPRRQGKRARSLSRWPTACWVGRVHGPFVFDGYRPAPPRPDPGHAERPTRGLLSGGP